MSELLHLGLYRRFPRAIVYYLGKYEETHSRLVNPVVIINNFQEKGNDDAVYYAAFNPLSPRDTFKDTSELTYCLPLTEEHFPKWIVEDLTDKYNFTNNQRLVAQAERDGDLVKLVQTHIDSGRV